MLTVNFLLLHMVSYMGWPQHASLLQQYPRPLPVGWAAQKRHSTQALATEQRSLAQPLPQQQTQAGRTDHSTSRTTPAALQSRPLVAIGGTIGQPRRAISAQEEARDPRVKSEPEEGSEGAPELDDRPADAEPACLFSDGGFQ